MRNGIQVYVAVMASAASTFAEPGDVIWRGKIAASENIVIGAPACGLHGPFAAKHSAERCAYSILEEKNRAVRPVF